MRPVLPPHAYPLVLPVSHPRAAQRDRSKLGRSENPSLDTFDWGATEPDQPKIIPARGPLGRMPGVRSLA